MCMKIETVNIGSVSPGRDDTMRYIRTRTACPMLCTRACARHSTYCHVSFVSVHRWLCFNTGPEWSSLNRGLACRYAFNRQNTMELCSIKMVSNCPDRFISSNGNIYVRFISHLSTCCYCCCHCFEMSLTFGV